jgi:hypothetical protein
MGRAEDEPERTASWLDVKDAMAVAALAEAVERVDWAVARGWSSLGMADESAPKREPLRPDLLDATRARSISGAQGQ